MLVGQGWFIFDLRSEIHEVSVLILTKEDRSYMDRNLVKVWHLFKLYSLVLLMTLCQFSLCSTFFISFIITKYHSPPFYYEELRHRKLNRSSYSVIGYRFYRPLTYGGSITIRWKWNCSRDEFTVEEARVERE